jgi:hypothetical protein
LLQGGFFGLHFYEVLTWILNFFGKNESLIALEKWGHMGVKKGLDWLSEFCGLQGYIGYFPALSGKEEVLW